MEWIVFGIMVYLGLRLLATRNALGTMAVAGASLLGALLLLIWVG